MNFREQYKRANDQITASETLKRKTKNRLLEKQEKHRNRFVLKLVNITAIFLFVFSIVWLSASNQNNQTEQADPLLSLVIPDKTMRLPTVDNQENFVNLLAECQNNQKEEIKVESSLDAETNSTNNTYSQTNEQVEGVSEADIVKTDGDYLYTVMNQRLAIVKADSLQIVTQLDYTDFVPSQLFLQENHLVVLGVKQNMPTQENNIAGYCYDIAWRGDVCAIVYDITQKDAIVEKRRVEVNGYLQTARMIEDKVYFIINQTIAWNEQTKQEPEQLKPTYCDDIISSEEKRVEFSDIYYFPGQIQEANYLIIASFSVKDAKELEVNTFLGAGNQVYCSQENLYVTKSHYDENWEKAETEIYRFALQDGKVTYQATGKVEGSLLNQFSMDEYNGYFRIATTQNSQTSENAIYVLNQDLTIVGSLKNLAIGERIYSVRYEKERAYLVTFKQIDPLFAIDLSNPYAPKVLGELKVPGFSNYLHFYDENHLIGIGQNTKEQNGNVTTEGMKVSLFEVENATDLKEISTVIIGQRGTYSQALGNHKAILFSKEKNLLAFPITIMEIINHQTKITLQGAIVYGFTPEKEIYEKARIAYPEDSYEQAQRCLYIRDTFYVCGTKSIRAFDLETMQEIGKIEIKSKAE